MILVDDRVGSRELAEPLKKVGLRVDVTRLTYGDVAFVGRGPQGRDPFIGIELKTLQDCVGSLRTGRLAGHQVPGLIAAYDYVWLIVEGEWRAGRHGELLRKTWRGSSPIPGTMPASELEKHLLTLELHAGLRVRTTATRAETLRFLGTLYHWWTDKAWDQHQSHLVAHRPASFLPISERRRTLMTLPGIGRHASLAVEQHFRSLERAVRASVTDWASIVVAGKRLGLKTAERIHAYLRQED